MVPMRVPKWWGWQDKIKVYHNREWASRQSIGTSRPRNACSDQHQGVALLYIVYQRPPRVHASRKTGPETHTVSSNVPRMYLRPYCECRIRRIFSSWRPFGTTVGWFKVHILWTSLARHLWGSCACLGPKAGNQPSQVKRLVISGDDPS